MSQEIKNPYSSAKTQNLFHLNMVCFFGVCNADQQQQSKPIIASFELLRLVCAMGALSSSPMCHYEPLPIGSGTHTGEL